MKIFTTNSWWIFGLFMLAATALALLINGFQAVGDLSYAESGGNRAARLLGPAGRPAARPRPDGGDRGRLRPAPPTCPACW
jgi:hypothetical protein